MFLAQEAIQIMSYLNELHYPFHSLVQRLRIFLTCVDFVSQTLMRNQTLHCHILPQLLFVFRVAVFDKVSK